MALAAALGNSSRLSQSCPARHGRRPDRVSAGLLDRASAADRAFFGFDDDDFGKSFTILIQLGAILALLSIYFTRLWNLARGFFTDSGPRARFVIGVLLAFLPAAVMGALSHGFIKAVLFDVWIVCVMLILGGFVLLWVDRLS